MHVWCCREWFVLIKTHAMGRASCNDLYPARPDRRSAPHTDRLPALLRLPALPPTRLRSDPGHDRDRLRPRPALGLSRAALAPPRPGRPAARPPLRPAAAAAGAVRPPASHEPKEPDPGNSNPRT